MDCGVIGYPLLKTLSPSIFAMLSSWEKSRIQYDALKIDPESFPLSLQLLKQMSIKGFNVTIPFKEKIVPYLDQISPMAELIGAVNVVTSKQSLWRGENSDYWGLLEVFKEHQLSLAGKNVLIFGVGGAAKASCVASLKAKAKSVTLCYRTFPTDKDIVFQKKLKPIFSGSDVLYLPLSKKIDLNPFSLIINATPVGQKGFPRQHFLNDSISSLSVFMDLVYYPFMTPGLCFAVKKNCKIIDGLDLLIWQALKSYEFFFQKLTIKDKNIYKKKLRKMLLNSI